MGRRISHARQRRPLAGVRRRGAWGNEYFILLHYSETIPAPSMILKSYRGEFEAVLASLTVTE